MIRVILWDIDDTLLDFHAAEREAIKKLFGEFELGECTDEMLKRYSAINRSYWKRLELGEITKPQVLIGRFKDFFESEGLDVGCAEAFNEAYQVSLGDTIVYRDDSYNIISSLRGKVKQYAVSNGTVIAQNKKLRLSGLGELMDGIFLSEHLGVEKPNAEFFDKVFDAIEKVDKSEIMIVGDSLSSDIKGGNNAGIKTCWYNPAKTMATPELRIDYVITDLHEIYDIIL